jgi:hypothetical protein
MLIGVLTLTGCAHLLPVATPCRNQFESLPQCATTPPEIRDFLPPLQLLDQILEERERSIEQELDACLSGGTCKQPT